MPELKTLSPAQAYDQKVLKALRLMKRWYSSPGRWCKGALAKTRAGNPTHCTLYNSHVHSMCLYGNACRQSQKVGIGEGDIRIAVIRAIVRTEGRVDVSDISFNDRAGTSFEDVLKVVQLAIEIQEAELATRPA